MNLPAWLARLAPAPRVHAWVTSWHCEHGHHGWCYFSPDGSLRCSCPCHITNVES